MGALLEGLPGGFTVASLTTYMWFLSLKLAAKEQEVQLLQTQRDEISAHLQQYAAAYQQVSIEREEFQRQYLLQAQLMDRLQHDEVQGKVSAEMHLKELQQSKVRH